MDQQDAYAICRCQLCGGKIEFNIDGFDANSPPVISCPHCEASTQLYLPAPRRSATKRITLTKSQSALPVVKGLLDLLLTIEQDGTISEAEARNLADWLAENATTEIPAFAFLSKTLGAALAKGDFRTEDGFQIQTAIEQVLPKALRIQVAETRRTAWHNSPASEAQRSYLRDLGGAITNGMTRAEASAGIESLSRAIGATEKQLNFIRSLGGDPPPGLSKREASLLIDELLWLEDRTDSRRIFTSGSGPV